MDNKDLNRTPKQVTDILTRHCWDAKPERRITMGDLKMNLKRVYNNFLRDSKKSNWTNIPNIIHNQTE